MIELMRVPKMQPMDDVQKIEINRNRKKPKMKRRVMVLMRYVFETSRTNMCESLTKTLKNGAANVL